MTDERAALLMDAMAEKEAADEGDPAADILAAVAKRAAHALRVKGMLVEALEAALALTEAIDGDYAPDHHVDDCPGDCDDHSVVFLADDAYQKGIRALQEARKEPA